MLKFEELDNETRKWMLLEFEEECNKDPYLSYRLSSIGKEKFREIMKKAINSGDIVSLRYSLSNPSFWQQTESVIRGNTSHERVIDPNKAAKLLAHTEFTTWYTRGFARRLMEEDVDSCEIYRAEMAGTPRCECTQLEGKKIKVKDVYDGHRAKYHPIQNNSAFSIPSGPSCHHTIKRLQ